MWPLAVEPKEEVTDLGLRVGGKDTQLTSRAPFNSLSDLLEARLREYSLELFR